MSELDTIVADLNSLPADQLELVDEFISRLKAVEVQSRCKPGVTFWVDGKGWTFFWFDLYRFSYNLQPVKPTGADSSKEPVPIESLTFFFTGQTVTVSGYGLQPIADQCQEHAVDSLAVSSGQEFGSATMGSRPLIASIDIKEVKKGR